MSNFVLISLAIIAVFSITVYLGYIIEERSRAAGIVFVIAGLFSGTVLIINYFVEVPFLVFVASLSAVIGAGLYSAFEVARKDAMQDSS